MYIAKHNYPTHEKNLDDMINFFFFTFLMYFCQRTFQKKDRTLIGNMFVNSIHYFKHHFILWLLGVFFFFFLSFMNLLNALYFLGVKNEVYWELVMMMMMMMCVCACVCVAIMQKSSKNENWTWFMF
jgi:hypothetical protein